MNWQERVIVVCVWLIVFSGIYINVTRRASPGGNKENSLVWFRILSPLALILSILFYYSEIGALVSSTGGDKPLSSLIVIGLIFFVAGLVLRWIAVFSLGKSFTVQVVVQPGQQLITKGVFRLIRHPSYTGLLLYNIGLGILMANWISFLILFILPLIAILNRIAYEEKIMKRHFGEDYSSYVQISKKLIPWLY